MSDASRIHGQGTGFSGFDERQRPKGDVARFRKGRGAGDTVRGVFLRMETPEMGWINLEGEELLARLPGEGIRPSPGDAVLFVIEAMDPEPLLRILPQQGVLLRSPLPLARQAAIYSAKRDEFDGLLRARLWTPMDEANPGVLHELDADTARNAMLDFLARDAEALEAYALVQLWAESLRAACRDGGLVVFRHLPWLCPAAACVEMAVLRSFATGKEESRLLAGLSLQEGPPGPTPAPGYGPGARPGQQSGHQPGTESAPPASRAAGRLRLSASPSGGRFFYRLLYSANLGGSIPSSLPELLQEAGGKIGTDNFRLANLAHAPEADTELLAHILALTANAGALHGKGRFSRKV